MTGPPRQGVLSEVPGGLSEALSETQNLSEPLGLLPLFLLPLNLSPMFCRGTMNPINILYRQQNCYSPPVFFSKKDYSYSSGHSHN